MMIRVVIVLLLLVGAATAQERTAHFSVAHREGQPSRIEVQIEPHLGRREIYFDMEKGRARSGDGIWLRRRLQAVEPGSYRLEYLFPEGGTWSFYVHHGSGLAGFDAYTRMEISLVPGEIEQASQAFRYFPHDAERLPAYVQPMGYAGFGLLAALLVFVVARILGRLRRQLQAEAAI